MDGSYGREVIYLIHRKMPSEVGEPICRPGGGVLFDSIWRGPRHSFSYGAMNAGTRSENIPKAKMGPTLHPKS